MEDRLCPTVALTLDALALPGRVAQLTGHYSGPTPENVTITLTGAVAQFSTTPNANGNYSVTTSPEVSLGTVYAVAVNQNQQTVGSASDVIAVDVPVLTLAITNFSASSVTVAGTLTDIDAPGRTVTFSNAAAGETQTDAGGNFSLTMSLASAGPINASVTNLWSQTATASATPINTAPAFTGGEDQTVNEDAGAQTVTGWATNLSAGPANESAQSLTFVVQSNSNLDLFSDAPSIDANGNLTFTPAANANGVATITVVLQDNGGTLNGGADASATYTFAISVAPVNDCSVTLYHNALDTYDILTATIGNGDATFYQYVWTVNGQSVETHTSTSATDSFNVSQANVGDTIQVTITPNAGSVSGAAASASLTLGSSSALTFVSLYNYLANYTQDPAANGDPGTGGPSGPVFDDVMTAQVATANPNNDALTYQYVWTVAGQLAQTHTTSNVTDTFDLTQAGEGFCGQQVAVTVTLLDNGVAVSQAAAGSGDQTCPGGIVWVMPPAPPANAARLAPAAPTFVYQGGATRYSATSGEGAPQGFVIGQVQTITTGNAVAYSIICGNANGWLEIDGQGKVKVAVTSLPLTAATTFFITIRAADSANPAGRAFQTTSVMRITLKQTVVVTGDFVGVAYAANGQGEDAIDLKFVRVGSNLSAGLTVPYTINWGSFSATAYLSNSEALTGQVTFAANQSVVDVVLTPTGAINPNGFGQFTVAITQPAAGAAYFVPQTWFYLTSASSPAFPNAWAHPDADVSVYNGTRLFANANPGAGVYGVSYTDIQQGYLGDCAFLAAVAAIANTDPQVIYNAIRDNGNGTATVSLYRTVGAAATQVTVPIALNGGYNDPRISGNYQMSEAGYQQYAIWPQVLEAAYVRLFGVPENCWAYEVFQRLTGRTAQHVYLESTPPPMTPAQAANLVAQLAATDAAAVFSTKSSAQGAIAVVTMPGSDSVQYQLVGNHAYALLGITQDVFGNTVIELFNPHSPSDDAGPVRSQIIYVPLESFATYFRRIQYLPPVL